MARIPNLNTVADIIDRLIIINIKIWHLEGRKRELSDQQSTDHELIARLDKQSRDQCEIRTMLKNELNVAFSEQLPMEIRTFSSPGLIIDIINEMAEESAVSYLRGQLGERLSELYGY